MGTAGALCLCGDTRLWPKAFSASSLHLRGLISELTTLVGHQESGIPWVPIGQRVSLPPWVNSVALGFADKLFHVSYCSAASCLWWELGEMGGAKPPYQPPGMLMWELGWICTAHPILLGLPHTRRGCWSRMST